LRAQRAKIFSVLNGPAKKNLERFKRLAKKNLERFKRLAKKIFGAFQKLKTASSFSILDSHAAMSGPVRIQEQTRTERAL
jgi:formamidopyrimidine-DNA glycosylase